MFSVECWDHRGKEDLIKSETLCHDGQAVRLYGKWDLICLAVLDLAAK